MSALLGTKYAGFILGAYGITFAVLIGMVLWVVLTTRNRRADLAKLEADGVRRASSQSVQENPNV